jgi:hypothetical protein
VETKIKPDIPESGMEHVVQFSSHWVDRWSIPNPFVSVFFEGLRPWEVTLADFAFRADTKNVSETALIVTVQKLRTTIVVGLDHVTFRTNNPDWDMAPELVKLFDASLELFQFYVKSAIKSQECTIVFHVTPGSSSLAASTANLVNARRIGNAEFYGLSKYTPEASLSLDRSLKYDGGVFFRLTRKFDSAVKFADVALAMYADEVAALGLIDVKDLV